MKGNTPPGPRGHLLIGLVPELLDLVAGHPIVEQPLITVRPRHGVRVVTRIRERARKS